MSGLTDTFPRRSENIVFRKVAGEYILVPIAASAADVESIFNLNKTGAAIWEKLDGKKSLKDIIADIQEEYEVEDYRLERDIISFVDEMIAAKLIEA
jgi:hypothetical protein